MINGYAYFFFNSSAAAMAQLLFLLVPDLPLISK
jgi:hypothetical protein